MSVNVFSTKVLIGDTILTSPTGDGTAILRGHPSHARGPACWSAKVVPSFLSNFKTLSIGPTPGIEPAIHQILTKFTLAVALQVTIQTHGTVKVAARAASECRRALIAKTRGFPVFLLFTCLASKKQVKRQMSRVQASVQGA